EHSAITALFESQSGLRIIEFCQVVDMNNEFVLANPFHQGPAGDWQSLSQPFCKRLRLTTDGYRAKFITIDNYQATRCGFAERMRLVQHRIEHRREIAGRRINDLQYLGSSGLLIQRLARLSQEPRVLHRDDRLCSKVLQQRDLLVGERPYFLAKCGN